MATLTAAQITRMRRALGVQTDNGESNYESVFTDADLQDYYDWADSNLTGALYYATRDLRTNAAKLYDYTAGQTSEKLSQVYRQLADMMEQFRVDWQREAGQIKVVGMRPAPTVWREEPNTLYDPGLRDRLRRYR